MLTVPHAATRDAMSVLIRGWKLIAGFAVPFGLIALLMCSLQKPVYEASATLYVTSGGDTSRVAASYDGIMGAAGRVASYSKLIDSDRVLARAVKAAGLNMTVAQAKNVAQAEVVPQSILIKVSAKDQNPEVAQRFANALAQSMIDTIAALDVPIGGGPSASRLTVVTPATLNPHPVSPTTLLDVTLATIGGLFVGVAAVLTRERLNNTVRDQQDIEKILGVRPLGGIPHDETLGAALTIDFRAPRAASAGAFRHLRTALSIAHSEASHAMILVTSPREDEGKSTVALNLAAAFAESGSTVVLVDADLANPAVARRMGNGEVPGLADVINSQVPPLHLSALAIDDLKVICAGRMHDNDPAGLLASSACGNFFKELAESFDYVIVDSPSLLDGPEAEAAARWADGVLLVARAGRSKISDCRASVTQLYDIGAESIGVVLNDARLPGGPERPTRPLAFRPGRLRSAEARSLNHRSHGAAST